MNKRISQFSVAETLDPGDFLPIVNEQVTKKTPLSAITEISISFTRNNYLPVAGGTITNSLQINNDLTVEDDVLIKDRLTTVSLISTRNHGTSLQWNNAYTSVLSNSATWATGGTLVQNNSAKWEGTYTTVYANSAKWESAYNLLEANSYDWSNSLNGTGIVGYIPKFIDTTGIGNSEIYENISGNVGIGIVSPINDAKLTVNGKIKGLGDLEIAGFSTLSSAWFKGGVRIDGTLSALGGTVNINTTISETSSLRIFNTGVGPALQVTQIGAQNVASFSDENGVILCVTDKGNVGIGTCNTDATVKLDVQGGIKVGSAVIRDWFTPGNFDIANVRPGSNASSTFGSIIEGYNFGHVLIGIRSNDVNDGFSVISKSALGALYDKNCFTVMNNGFVGIGVQAPSSNLHLVGQYRQTVNGSGDYIINIQDGTGRVNHLWNTTGGTSPTFTKANESATRWLMGGQGQNPFEVFISQDGSGITAGTVINWTKLLTINRDSQYVGIGVDIPLRHLHIANRGGVATEIVLEQIEGKSDFRKWNFVVSGGSNTTGSGVGSYFYIRQLNDAGTGGNIPAFFAANGRIGINNEFVPAEALDVSGNIKLGHNITMGKGVTTGDVSVEVGVHRTNSGNAYVDLHAVSGEDYSSRFLRSSGANGLAHLINKGTGALSITQENLGSIYLKTNSLVRVEVDSSGNVGINTDPTQTIQERLEIKGNVLVGNSTDLNYIRFAGVSGDGSNHTVIAERLYNGVDRSELLLAKGNDPGTGNVGPDRIRLLAGAIAFDTYDSVPWVPGVDLNDLINSGNTRVFINNAGNVGIGDAFPTNQPITSLHINKSGYGAIMLGNNNSTGFHITKETTDNSFNIWTGVWSTGPTNRLKITNIGHMGLNQTDPKTRLHVSGVGAALWGDNSISGGNAVIPNKVGTYPPDGVHGRFSAVFESVGGTDDGGILIITSDTNDDERAIEVWDNINSKSVFEVRAESGNIKTAGKLNLSNSLLEQYRVAVNRQRFTPSQDEYTLSVDDTGGVLYIRTDSTSNGVVYVNNLLPIGFNIMIVNGSTRSVSIQAAPGSGTQVLNIYNKISIGNQNGICNLIVIDTNKVLISGDLS